MCYKAGMPELVYKPRVCPRVLACICVFFVTAMHVWSLARCVWEWRPFAQYTMSTGSSIPILVLLTSKMQVWTFWYILLLCESPLFGTIRDNWLKTE